MSYILLFIINLIIVFIAWIVLYSKVKKNTIPSRIEEYTREVERLIIELNRALEDVVNISEERIDELKSLIKKAERIINKSNRKTVVQKTIKTEKGLDKRKGDLESSNERIKAEENSNIDDSKEHINNDRKRENQIKLHKGSLVERTGYLFTMGYSREEIAEMLGITPVEVDFLKSLSLRKT